MSYTANQYNYATPLSKATSLVGEISSVYDANYFTLSNNRLDGSYYPITGDVGLWGATVSTSDGTLDIPLVVTIVEDITVHAIRITGSQYNFPVDFTIKFYNESNLLYTEIVTSNDKVQYTACLPEALEVTKYEISISKISTSGSAARLYNLYNPAYLKRTETLSVGTTEESACSAVFNISGIDTLKTNFDDTQSHIINTLGVISDVLNLKEHTSTQLLNDMASFDSIKVECISEASAILNKLDTTTDIAMLKHNDSSHITNTIDVTDDLLSQKVTEDVSYITNIIDVTNDMLNISDISEGKLLNVHTLMKEPFRQIYGKVYITYTDPMLEDETTIEPSSEAYNSVKEQLLDSEDEPEYPYFALYANDLTGKYRVSDASSQIGWVSKEISNESGFFEINPSVTINFFPRPVLSLVIAFDGTHDNLARDFTVDITKDNGEIVNYTFVDNKEVTLNIRSNVPDAVSVKLTVSRVQKPFSPATVLSIPVSSTILYKGYQDHSEIVSIDLLEELSYENDVEMLGGVSANEITVVLDNSSRNFFFNSDSIVSKQLRRNRKIVPYLGVEVIQGEIEWYTLGTFWSYKWDVPINGLTATVVGFDTIGLLGNTTYYNHQIQTNKSIGWLLEYILNDAKKDLYFIEYSIDASLYDVIIPYAWFEYGSHAAALRKLSLCYPMHIYCDRDGKICAVPHKLHLDYYYDTWSDSTNVIEKSYSSLHTALPNTVNVTVYYPVLRKDMPLTEHSVPFTVNTTEIKLLNFNSPYIDDIKLSVDCDSTLSYSYETYSWGIIIEFKGTGIVRSILCSGTIVDTSSSYIMTKQDALSVKLDGAVTRDIKADFIQTKELATLLIDRLFSLLNTDKYDATVMYRGDISLTINDPILLRDGVAPDNRYNIMRHQLSWNGGLTGSAELNT